MTGTHDKSRSNARWPAQRKLSPTAPTAGPANTHAGPATHARPATQPRARPAQAGRARRPRSTTLLLAHSPRQGPALPVLQQSLDLRFAVPAVPAGSPDRGQLAAARPPGHRLRVDPKNRSDLRRGEEPIVRLDLGSHCNRSSRCYVRDRAVTDSD